MELYQLHVASNFLKWRLRMTFGNLMDPNTSLRASASCRDRKPYVTNVSARATHRQLPDNRPSGAMRFASGNQKIAVG